MDQESKKFKLVWFIRHCEGLHNPNSDFSLPDPSLTPSGHLQASTLFSHHLLSSSKHQPQIILSSPLTRCLETSLHLANHFKQLRIMPIESLQESYAGYRPCDTGKPTATLAKEFGTKIFDFSHLAEKYYEVPVVKGKSEEEETESRENEVKARLQRFLKVLGEVSEKNVVVVGHKGILRRLFPQPQHTIFSTGEIRLFRIDLDKMTSQVPIQTSCLMPITDISKFR